MRVLKIYKNGKRVVGNSAAFISPYPLEDITNEIDLTTLEDHEFEELRVNPGKLDKFRTKLTTGGKKDIIATGDKDT